MHAVPCLSDNFCYVIVYDEVCWQVLGDTWSGCGAVSWRPGKSGRGRSKLEAPVHSHCAILTLLTLFPEAPKAVQSLQAWPACGGCGSVRCSCRGGPEGFAQKCSLNISLFCQEALEHIAEDFYASFGGLRLEAVTPLRLCLPVSIHGCAG